MHEQPDAPTAQVLTCVFWQSVALIQNVREGDSYELHNFIDEGRDVISVKDPSVHFRSLCIAFHDAPT